MTGSTVIPGEIIGSGRTAEVFTYSPAPDGSPRIVKLFFANFPRESAAFEYEMTQRLHAAGLPVPRTDDLITHEGRLGIVFERIEGVLLSDYLDRHFWRASYVGRLMGELHAQLHTTDLAALPDLPPANEQLQRRIKQAPDTLPEQARARALDMLAALPDGGLNHGDFHVQNIILTPQRAVVIDWIMVSRGAPLADVARTALLMRIGMSPDPLPAILRPIENWVRARLVRAYLDTYFARTGTTRANLQTVLLPVVAARFLEPIPGELPARLRVIEALLDGKPGPF